MARNLERICEGIQSPPRPVVLRMKVAEEGPQEFRNYLNCWKVAMILDNSWRKIARNDTNKSI